jgi:hypothetical protein
MRNNLSSSHETSDLARRREEYLESRIAAGRVIDVETCEIEWWWARIVDPYGVDPDSDPCVGRVTFVISAESDGPVCYYDLPEDKRRALDARIDRESRAPTTAEGVRDVLLREYVRAVAALDDVIYDLVILVDVGGRFPGVPLDLMRCGVRLALAELGKQGTPLQERLERKFRSFERIRAKPPMQDGVEIF